jgi:uncharacterized iron-regulated protein
MLALAICSACRPSPLPERIVTEANVLEPGIYRVRTGEKLDEEGFLVQLSAYRFVIVGESHDDRWHHEVQWRIYRGLVERVDGPVALGMEMFQQPYQDVLDDFVAGTIDEAEMLEATRWTETWGFDIEFYAAKWRLARQRGYPIVGLNIPREIVRAVGRGGLDSLDDDLRSTLPEIDLSNEAYRDHLRAIFKQHGMESEERLEFFYQAQVLWDEAMAERAVTFMAEREDVPLMVVLAGRGHVERGHGIPSRIARRIGKAEDIVTIVPVTVGSEHQENNRDLRVLQGAAVADYVWIGGEPLKH